MTPHRLVRLGRYPLALFLVVAACCRGQGANPDAGRDVDFTITLGRENVVAVTERTLESGPGISGALRARKEATVRAEVGGPLLENRAEPGRRVSRGEELARIDDGALSDQLQAARQAVRSAEDALETARRDSQRSEELAKGGALAPRDLDRARTALAQAEALAADARARVAQAGQAAGRTRVKAPLTGVVSERPASAGDIVQPGTPLFTVVDPSSLRLEATVPADALAMVKVGTKVDFAVTGYPARTLQGTIELVNPAVDPATGQVRIYVTLPNEKGTLLAGLFARGRVASESRRGLAIPAEAVDPVSSPPSVFVLRDGKVQRVAVELGLRDEVREEVLVTKGLGAGDTVLLGSARATVPEGAAVRLADAR
jgi:RND family efflux transporter MFP subunit